MIYIHADMKYNAMKKGSKTDWRRLNEMGDKAIDTSDIPELDEAFFQRAKILAAPRRTTIQSIFEKFARLLSIRHHNGKKPAHKSSLSRSIGETGNPEA